MSREEERQRERERLRQLKARQPETDDFHGTGVVLSDGIKFYCEQFDLITPLREANLKPANYKLRVGDEYAIGGRLGTLSSERGHDQLTIPPFEVAIIKTRETINMPRFLIGRWNIQVKRAYEGLLWVGGPQVDAGYVGHLFCPIYNLSNTPVTLNYDDGFAVIDFEKTTKFHEGHSVKYPEVPDRVLFEDYDPQDLQSALAAEIKSFRERMLQLEKGTESRIKQLESVTYTAISILFAALAVIATSTFSTAVTIWTWLAVGISVFALLVAWGR